MTFVQGNYDVKIIVRAVGVSETCGLLASIKAKSIFIEVIKTNKYEDGDLDEIL